MKGNPTSIKINSEGVGEMGEYGEYDEEWRMETRQAIMALIVAPKLGTVLLPSQYFSSFL